MFTIIGLVMLWRASRAGVDMAGRRLFGLVVAGWGLFNLVEGIIDHQILGIHHVNPAGALVFWDVAFLIFGAVLLLGGLGLARSARATDRAAR